MPRTAQGNEKSRNNVARSCRSERVSKKGLGIAGDGKKILVHSPKSGKGAEPTANRLRAYIQRADLKKEDRVFKLCYSAARARINRLGQKTGIKLKPHDPGQHSTAFPSRNHLPLEIISKVLLRHQNLKTTQVYLGKVSEGKAIRWMDILHGK